MGAPYDAVLFDSGGVLIRPVGGRWNPRADFESIVLAVAPHLTTEQLDGAVTAGDAFLAASAATPSRDEYHQALLTELGVPATPALLAALDAPAPPGTVVEPYPEVVGVLEELGRRAVPMAIVSDAWPDLPELYEGLGLRHHFAAFAISEVLGCDKPDPRMYHHASDALGVEPSRCLFLDDHVELVDAALDLGYGGRVVRRPDGPPTERAGPHRARSIADLTEMLTLVRGRTVRDSGG